MVRDHLAPGPTYCSAMPSLPLVASARVNRHCRLHTDAPEDCGTIIDNGLSKGLFCLAGLYSGEDVEKGLRVLHCAVYACTVSAQPSQPLARTSASQLLIDIYTTQSRRSSECWHLMGPGQPGIAPQQTAPGASQPGRFCLPPAFSSSTTKQYLKGLSPALTAPQPAVTARTASGSTA